MTDREYSPKQYVKVVRSIIRWGMPLFWLSLLGGALISLASYIYNLFAGMLMGIGLEAVKLDAQSDLWILLLQVTLVALLALACRFFGHRINTYSSVRLFERQYHQVVQHWLNIKEAFMKKKHTGDVIAQLTYDLEALDGFYSQGFRQQVLGPFLQGIAAIATMAWVDWRLIAISLVIGTATAFITSRFSSKVHQAGVGVRAQNDALTQMLMEILQGQVTIRTSSMEDLLKEKYIASLEQKLDSQLVEKKTMHFIAFCSDFSSTISTFVFLAMSMLLAQNGEIYLPNIMVAIPMQALVTQMISSIGATLTYLSGFAVAGKRILELLSFPIEDKRTMQAPPTARPDTSILAFNQVFFAYSETGEVLKDCTFSANANDQVAIVSPSGAGKTTILKLIAGFFDTYKGSIKIEGTEFMKSSLPSWRKKIAFVEQEAPIFDMIIFENIALGRSANKERPTENEVINAAKLANAHEFIVSMPNGYASEAGELGGKLSGGQRQRIALARAFLSNASIILLDEPTASLDFENEAAIKNAIDQMKANRTSIIVSHRLSTVKQANKILVLDQGRIVECGGHDELMARKGQYYRMVCSEDPVSDSKDKEKTD